MGMYDEIACEYPLPRTGYRVPDGHVFQTKSLESLLDRYTITPDGRLVLHKEEWEEVPERDRPYHGTPQWVEPLGRWIGSLKTVPVGEVDIPYHGDVYFYDAFRVASTGEAGERVWLEYKARFTEGRVTRVEVEEVRPLPPLETVDLAGTEYPAARTGLGSGVISLNDEAEVEPDAEPDR